MDRQTTCWRRCEHTLFCPVTNWTVQSLYTSTVKNLARCWPQERFGNWADSGQWLVEHTLCLEQLYGCLFQPLYICTWAGHLLYCFCRYLWSTHFAWNSNTTVYSSHCTIVFSQTGRSLTLVFLSRLVEHTLCLEQLYGCLFQPLYACTWTNLRLTYSGQTCGWSENNLILTNESQSMITRLSTNHTARKIEEWQKLGKDIYVENRQIDRYTAVFIESLPQLKNGWRILLQFVVSSLRMFWILKCVLS